MVYKNLHLACGKVYASDFLNIDEKPRGLSFVIAENEILKIPTLPNSFVMKYNLANGIPADFNSISYIYHSHFLEHLDKINGFKFLKNCYDVLELGGRMRIAVPDFQLWCSNYTSKNENFFKWYKSNFCKNKDLTHLEIFNQVLYQNHLYMYDFETLNKILQSIGFHDIEKIEWGISNSFPSLNDLENNDSLRKPESLVVECKK